MINSSLGEYLTILQRVLTGVCLLFFAKGWWDDCICFLHCFRHRTALVFPQF